jgi:hypothetical protein
MLLGFHVRICVAVRVRICIAIRVIICVAVRICILVIPGALCTADYITRLAHAITVTVPLGTALFLTPDHEQSKSDNGKDHNRYFYSINLVFHFFPPWFFG